MAACPKLRLLIFQSSLIRPFFPLLVIPSVRNLFHAVAATFTFYCCFVSIPRLHFYTIAASSCVSAHWPSLIYQTLCHLVKISDYISACGAQSICRNNFIRCVIFSDNHGLIEESSSCGASLTTRHFWAKCVCRLFHQILMADTDRLDTFETTFMLLFVWESAAPPWLQAVQLCEQRPLKGPAATIDGRFCTKRQQTAS